MSVRARRVSVENTISHQIALSDRHRLWGFNCPMVDIDFLVVEYDHSKPKAIIEYKHEYANIDFTKLTSLGMAPQSYKALETLANAAGIPFFVVRYKDDFSSWCLTPMNKYAQKSVDKTKNLTEKEYVGLLYKIRGYHFLPTEINENLNGGKTVA